MFKEDEFYYKKQTGHVNLKTEEEVNTRVDKLNNRVEEDDEKEENEIIEESSKEGEKETKRVTRPPKRYDYEMYYIWHLTQYYLCNKFQA